MTAEPDPYALVLAALWYGALRLAAGENLDPWPPEVAELAEEYFTRYRPRAQA